MSVKDTIWKFLWQYVETKKLRISQKAVRVSNALDSTSVQVESPIPVCENESLQESETDCSNRAVQWI